VDGEEGHKHKPQEIGVPATSAKTASTRDSYLLFVGNRAVVDDTDPLVRISSGL
jgi:hypothetical protein